MGGFSTRPERFWVLFRYTAIRWCPEDNFLANLSVPGVFSTRWARFRELFRYTSARWNPGDDFEANHSSSHELEPWEFFDTLRTFLRTVSVEGDTMMPRWPFTRLFEYTYCTEIWIPKKNTFSKNVPFVARIWVAVFVHSVFMVSVHIFYGFCS